MVEPHSSALEKVLVNPVIDRGGPRCAARTAAANGRARRALTDRPTSGVLKGTGSPPRGAVFRAQHYPLLEGRGRRPTWRRAMHAQQADRLPPEERQAEQGNLLTHLAGPRWSCKGGKKDLEVPRSVLTSRHWSGERRRERKQRASQLPGWPWLCICLCPIPSQTHDTKRLRDAFHPRKVTSSPPLRPQNPSLPCPAASRAARGAGAGPRSALISFPPTRTQTHTPPAIYRLSHIPILPVQESAAQTFTKFNIRPSDPAQCPSRINSARGGGGTRTSSISPSAEQ